VKLLYLLRHTKSSWDDPSIDDFERALNKRGLKAATLLANYCRQQDIRPEVVLCSPAKRARQTLTPLLPALGDTPVTFDRRLYEATQQTLLALIAELPHRCRSALLVGHNPGLQRLALHLVKADPANPAFRLLSDKLPTGGLVTLSTATDDWNRLAARQCTLDSFIRPSDLGGDD
jgi:phosphohistidine phosphatase